MQTIMFFIKRKKKSFQDNIQYCMHKVRRNCLVITNLFDNYKTSSEWELESLHIKDGKRTLSITEIKP